MQRTKLCFSVLLAGTLLFSACATVGSLNGGPKDETPPQVLECHPAVGAVNVRSNTVKITFDEFFSLNSPTDSIRITPAQKKMPEYATKGKSLTITLKDSLWENTTYHIDFGGSVIKDITEGNAMPVTSFVFSTGNAVDSFALNGKVLDAYTLKAAANACVMLYTAADDSCPLRDAPDFFTLTDRDGHFSFNHIPQREYHLYALADKNFNRRFDQADESFAFLPGNEAVCPSLPDTADSLSLRKEQVLYLFQEAPEKVRFLKNTSKEKGIHQFVFNLPTDTFRLEALRQPTPEYLLERHAAGDTLTVYFYDSSRTKTEDFQVFYDNGLDTVSLNPNGNPIGSQSVNKSDSAAAVRKPLGCKPDTKVEIGKRFTMLFDFPLRSVDTSAFVLTEMHRKNKDTNTLTDFRIRRDSSSMRRLLLDYPLRSSCDYLLLVKDSACVACDGRYNDTLRLSFSINGKKAYGNMNLWLKIAGKADYIVELVDARNAAAYSQILAADSVKDDSTLVRFVHLKEGKYRLRIIADENRNGQWDSGKYLLKRNAERLFYTEKEWDIKARITIEETIETTF